MKLGVELATSALVAAMLIALCAETSRAQTKDRATELRLTLSSESPWQYPDGWCRFSVDVSSTDGTISLRCGRTPVAGGPAVAGVSVQQRSLTESERSLVRRLHSSARLFEGDHVGVFPEGHSDLPVFMLIVGPEPPMGRTVALIVSGNPSFDSGPRKALLDWLLQERMKLQNAARAEK